MTAAWLLLSVTLAADPVVAADEWSAPDPAWEVDIDPLAANSLTHWTSTERAALDRGEAVSRHWSDSKGRAKGMSAVVVNTSADALWRVIVDFDAYVEFFPYVTASYTTRWEEAADHTHILAGYQLTTMGVNTRYRLDNRWYPDRGVLMFEVLPEGSGPISTGAGWWRVSPWSKGSVLLEYSVDMATQWWVPSVLERKAASRLPTVVRTTKRRAETTSAAAHRGTARP